MDTRKKQQLELAKSYCYSWRILDAYSIFRRYFDQIPFRAEEEHAEYIGLFVRVLLELGRENELKFYMGHLERWYEQKGTPGLGYQLAYIYMNLKEPRKEAARRIFEKLIADPAAADFHVKANIMLVWYYLEAGVLPTASRLIDAIGRPEEVSLRHIVYIWRAIIRRHEKRFEEGIALLKTVLEEARPGEDWYTYFSAKIALARIFIEQQAIQPANEILDELRHNIHGKRFKSIQVQLDHLNTLIQKHGGLGTLYLKQSGKDHWLTYRNRSIRVNGASPPGRFLLMLVKRKFLNKGNIAEKLLGRPYDAQRDDKLIYSYVILARHRLKTLGLPPAAIARRKAGYRLLPRVEVSKEN
jgi:hypothetical protein